MPTTHDGEEREHRCAHEEENVGALACGRQKGCRDHVEQGHVVVEDVAVLDEPGGPSHATWRCCGSSESKR